MNKIPELRDGVLKVVAGNFDYFKENPKHLAWAMMNFSTLHYVGRRKNTCHENPKDLVMETGDKVVEKTGNEEDSNLIYDAWAVTVSNQTEFPDVKPNLPLQSKPNKTLDEWISLLTDEGYEYHDLYPDARSVKDNLLCVIGTGYDWNKEGFITNTGPSDVDEIVFAGYTRVESEVRQDIRNAIIALRSDSSVAKDVFEFMKEVKINAGDNEAEKTYINDRFKVVRKIEKLDSNKKRKIMADFKYVCYLEAVVNEAKGWTEEQWDEAMKSNIYNYKGVDFDVSAVEMNHDHSTCGFDSGLESKLEDGAEDLRIERYSPRDRKWSSFVYALDNPKDPKVKRALAVVMRLSTDRIIRLSKKTEDKAGEEPAEDDETKKAREYLQTRRPNFEHYNPILEKAMEGDEEAIKILDSACNIPAPGWATIRYFALDERREMDESLKNMGVEERFGSKERTYYPLSDYSNMLTMPANAHSSYVAASIEIAKEIACNPAERDYSRKYALKFLKGRLPVLPYCTVFAKSFASIAPSKISRWIKSKLGKSEKQSTEQVL